MNINQVPYKAYFIASSFFKRYSWTYKNKHSTPLQLNFSLVASTAIFSFNLRISPRTAEYNQLHHNPASSLANTSLSLENTNFTYWRSQQPFFSWLYRSVSSGPRSSNAKYWPLSGATKIYCNCRSGPLSLNLCYPQSMPLPSKTKRMRKGMLISSPIKNIGNNFTFPSIVNVRIFMKKSDLYSSF